MTDRVSVAIIGGGQAGLSLSWHLTQADVDHVVLERQTAMHVWRDERWDSFCLVTPNWQCQLPGYRYSGDDPDGFMVAAELNRWLAGYLDIFQPSLREQVEVRSVRPIENEQGFTIETSAGPIRADQVVVATGGYHTPGIPRLAERLPAEIMQLHSSSYRNPDQLPDGPVLVVGTGQSGAQIAEDLHLAGRTVHLAVGNAPRFARRYRGRDVIAWMHDTGHYRMPVTDKPIEERHQDRTNHYVTGRDGGRDIDLRRFALEGMQLHGHLTAITDGQFSFADDLRASLDAADAVYNGINGLIDNHIATHRIDTAAGPSRYQPVWQPTRGESSLDVDGLAGVVWATGFHRNYRWLNAPMFDGAGQPCHVRGVTDVAGLYFLGLPWLHTWGSGRFAGIATDAEYLAEQILQSQSADRRLVAVAD